MKLYDCATAPSPRRLAEKGISIPTVQVDLRNGEQFSLAFRAINPDCTVPVLELDNGTMIADIVGICRYFEELYPAPPLMGRTAEEKAVIESWQRWIERDGFYAAMEAFRNSTSGLKGRLAGTGVIRANPRVSGSRPCAYSAFFRPARRTAFRQRVHLWSALHRSRHYWDRDS